MTYLFWCDREKGSSYYGAPSACWIDLEGIWSWNRMDLIWPSTSQPLVQYNELGGIQDSEVPGSDASPSITLVL